MQEEYPDAYRKLRPPSADSVMDISDMIACGEITFTPKPPAPTNRARLKRPLARSFEPSTPKKKKLEAIAPIENRPVMIDLTKD